MRKLLGAILFAASGLLFYSCGTGEDGTADTDTTRADNRENDRQRERDISFLSDAYYDGLKEIAKAEHAVSTAQHQDVKDLANAVLRDHRDLNDKIRSLASRKNYQLEKDSLPGDERDKIRENKKKGREYDRDFADDVEDHHESAVRRFEEVANDTDTNRDPEVKALASEALPKLREHLEKARAAKEKLKS